MTSWILGTLSKCSPFLKRFSKYVLVSASLTVVASFLISHFLGVFLMLFTPEGLEVMNILIEGIPVTIYTVSIVIPVEVSRGSFFLVLWVFQLICFLVAMRVREGIISTIRSVFEDSVKNIFRNNILSTPFIANAALIIVLAVYFLQESQGIPTGAPPEINKYEFYFLLTYASIFEEFTFRVLFIGVFEAVTIVRLYSYLVDAGERRFNRFSIFLRALAFPQKTKESLGLAGIWKRERMGLIPEEWLILIVSAVMFGLAHLLSGIGWEVGKVTHATFVGLVLGLIYIKFGFQASMILHWFFNNYFEAYSIASDFIPQIEVFSDFLDWLNTFLGVIFLAAIVYVFIVKLTKVDEEEKQIDSTPI